VVAVNAVVEMTGGVVAVTVVKDCEVSKHGGMVIGGGGKLGTNIVIFAALGCLPAGLKGGGG
jgi:hypothetical protein